MKRAITITAILVLSSWCMARRGAGGSHGNTVSGPGANQTQSPDGKGQVAATPKSDAAKSTTQDAPTTAPSATTASQSDIQKANADLQAVVAKLRGDFEKSQDFKDAVAEQQQAHDAYDTAMKSIADSLSTNPQYAAAVDERQSLEKKLADARVSAPDTVPQLAMDLMKARGTVKDLEKTLGGKNDALVAAKAKEDAADEKLVKLRADFEANMKSNSDYMAAQTALDAARGIKTASAK